MDIVKKDKARMLALEILAMSPSISKKDLADKLGVTRPTLDSWVNDPLFIDTWYKRYMEVAGAELPHVINSMIREAKEGNVQAGRLILEHFGKLDTRVKIQVESPFEKFMKLEVEDAEFSVDKEVTNGAISIGEQASSLLPDGDNLPPRNVSNDSPRFRKEEEDKSLMLATKKARKNVVTQHIQKMMYERRKRAKEVGLELLGAGRSTKSKRNKWWDKLERLEIKKFGKIKGERYEQ